MYMDLKPQIKTARTSTQQGERKIASSCEKRKRLNEITVTKTKTPKVDKLSNLQQKKRLSREQTDHKLALPQDGS